MRRRAMSRGAKVAAVVAVAAAVAAAGCGKSADSSSTAQTSESALQGLSATTPAATKDVDKVTWALYRGTSTVDPIYAFDYPDNSVLSVMCDSLLRQQPDGDLTPAVASSVEYTDPKTLVITLRDGVKFWDGTPVTPEDVAFSIDRQRDPRNGGLYIPTMNRIASISPTGADKVTIKFTKPDYLLRGELSSAPGVVTSKKVVLEQGGKYGTPGGSIMCTGPYKLKSWSGDTLSVVANPDYWDTTLQPRTKEIDFKGVPDEAALTAGLQTGEIAGTYATSLTSLDQLRSSGKVDIHTGPSFISDALIVSSLRGALADARVRQAISLALDRKGVIDTTYHGLAQYPRAIANPGTWGAGRAVYQAAWDKREPFTTDISAAKRLVQEAGAGGKTIVLGMSSEIKSIAIESNVLRSAAEAIGMKVRLKAVSAANYISFFVDPKAREGVDGFFTLNYPDWADPAGLYNSFASPEGVQNYSGYNNPKVTSLLEKARSTKDPEARAKVTVQAEEILNRDLPWIPVVQPDNELVMGKDLTGVPASFSYMNAPWAASLGGKG
ncbi:MAG: ABC transporter substrate-binding protein [Conexibacter sp.]